MGISPLFSVFERVIENRGVLGTQVSPILQLIVANQVALAAGCAAGVGMCFFFCGLQLFAHRQSPGRGPKVTVNAALPGPATIAGKATGQRTLPAPISRKPCYVYRASIWQLHESGGTKQWKKAADETGHLTFLVEDETGQLPVEPSGAELDLLRSISEEYGAPLSSGATSDGFSEKETVPEAVTNFLARNGIAHDRPIRVEEYCLEPETPVVVTGTVTRNSAVQASTPASISLDSSSVESTTKLPELATDSLAGTAGGPQPRQPEVIRLASGRPSESTTQMSQQSKIAAALAKAGLAQRDVWVTADTWVPDFSAGANGHSKSEQSQSNQTSNTVSALPLPTTMTMTMTVAMAMTIMKGLDDPTFIISSRDQPSGRTSLGWKSVALVLAGSTLATLSLYVLLLAHLR